ncbi:ABC transporter permease [Salinibacterium sp. SYSU T00001]|uniref:ABC transporter permease n=1 Tax=Homoserinimonas sedimenticola TaxID=2986805 RepID=UPI0022358CBF|nr:ABC transporter permease [Salinibacterium sedimenticola]MCW4385083.1 ABC transporter permease [Salinibacterium sedimenticola]
MRTAASALGFYRAPILLVSLLAGLMLFVPFLVLVATSWTSGGLLLFPPQGFSLRWYETVLQDPRWMEPFALSLAVSAAATLLAVIFGTAGALAVLRLSPRSARVVRTLFIVPIALPPVAYAIGLYGVNLQLDALRSSFVTLILGEALIALPYVFVVVSAATGRLDPNLRKAAVTLGAGWPLILRRVELPLLIPNIVAGAVFGFSIVFDEVVLSVFLLPPGVQTLPLKMLSASTEAFSPALTAASTMVSLLALIVLALFAWLSRAGARRMRKVSTP